MRCVHSLVLASICGVPCLAYAQTDTECVTFESLSASAQIQVGGGGLHAEGVDFWGSNFTLADGSVYSNGTVTVEHGGLAGGSSKELAVNNISLAFGGPLGQALKSIQFTYGWYGGNLNLTINGVSLNFDSVSQLHGTTVAGVTFDVVYTSIVGGEQGRVSMSGEILDDRFYGHLAIGGQELYIDDWCWSRQ